MEVGKKVGCDAHSCVTDIRPKYGNPGLTTGKEASLKVSSLTFSTIWAAFFIH